MTEPTEDIMDPIEDRLVRERPIPSPGFRGQLRRHLLDSGDERAAGARARFSIVAYAGSGTLLLLVAAIGVLGAGPLAA